MSSTSYIPRRRPVGRLLVLGWFTALSLLVSACGAGADTGNQEQAAACDVDVPNSATTVNVLAYTSPGIDPFSNAMVACTQGALSVKHGPVDFGGQLTKAALSLASPTPSYDVIEVYTSTLNQYADAGWLIPLDDLVTKYNSRYNLDDIDPKLKEQFTYKGKLYGLPMQVNVHEMVYRKDVFDKEGLAPPKTFDELTATLGKLKAAGFEYPLAMPLSASTYVSSGYFNSLKSLGGRFTAEGTTQATLNTPEAKQAMESLQQLVPYLPDDAINSDETTTTTALLKGDAAIGLTYSGSMGQLLDPASSDNAANFAFAVPPSVEAGGIPWGTVFVDGFGLAKNSKVDPDLLFQIAAVGTGAAATKAAGALVYPARTSVLQDPELGGSPQAAYWSAVTDTLAAGATGPQPDPWFGDLGAAIRPSLADGVFGKKGTDEALAAAQKAATDFLAKQGK